MIVRPETEELDSNAGLGREIERGSIFILKEFFKSSLGVDLSVKGMNLESLRAVWKHFLVCLAAFLNVHSPKDVMALTDEIKARGKRSDVQLALDVPSKSDDVP